MCHAAATGSIRLGSLFLTLLTRPLAGQEINPAEGQGTGRDFSRVVRRLSHHPARAIRPPPLSAIA